MMAKCHPNKANMSHGLCDACRLKRDYSKRKAKIQEWQKAHPERARAYRQALSRDLALTKVQSSKLWQSLCPTCRVVLSNAIDEGFRHLWD